MDYQFLAVVLLMLGFVLILAEVFLPSGGLISVMCVIAIVSSLWCAFKAWYGVNGLAFGVYLASLLVLIPTVIVGAFKLFPLTPFGRSVMRTPTLEEVTPYLREQQHLQSLVGQRGEAITQLAPGGMVKVGHERLHAFTEGLLVEQGTEIQVVDVRGNRVLVQIAAPVATGGKNDNGVTPSDTEPWLMTDESVDGPAESPLDFTPPQS